MKRQRHAVHREGEQRLGVAHLANRQRVGLSAVSVGRLMARMGLSPQRPLYRAYQQDSEAVRRWKDEEYPAIAARAAAEGATICFADEGGIRSDHHAGPPGRRPARPRSCR